MAKSWKENNTLLRENLYNDFDYSIKKDQGLYSDFPLNSDDEREDVRTFLAQLKEVEEEYNYDNSMEAWDAFDELNFFDELNKWEDDIDPAVEKLIDYYKKEKLNPTIGEVYDLLNYIDEYYETDDEF